MNERSMTWALLVSPVLLAGGFLLFVWLPQRSSPAQSEPAAKARHRDPRLRPRPRSGATGRRARAARRPGAKAHPLDQLTSRGLRAIRSTLGLTQGEYANAGFAAIPAPQTGDWRLGPGRDEEHQSWALYVRAEPNGSKGRRRRLILRRVGPCDARKRRTFEPLRQWMTAFFGRPTRWGAPLTFPDKGRVRSLTDGTTWRQHHTGTLLTGLRHIVPSDAAALLAVSCEDLYPEESWNFVFGEATIRARVGVYSLARLYPSFTGDKWTPYAGRLGLLRAMKMLTHETGHMFGLHHCVTFHCIMNGSNGMDETDQAPLHLCPLCLSKLAWNLKLDVRRRYATLARILQAHGLKDEAAWYWRQAKRMSKVR